MHYDSRHPPESIRGNQKYRQTVAKQCSHVSVADILRLTQVVLGNCASKYLVNLKKTENIYPMPKHTTNVMGAENKGFLRKVSRCLINVICTYDPPTELFSV